MERDNLRSDSDRAGERLSSDSQVVATIAFDSSASHDSVSDGRDEVPTGHLLVYEVQPLRRLHSQGQRRAFPTWEPDYKGNFLSATAAQQTLKGYANDNQPF